MTSDTIRKRAERLRRKEAGEVRVEGYLPQEHVDNLDRYCAHWSCTRSQALTDAVRSSLALARHRWTK